MIIFDTANVCFLIRHISVETLLIIQSTLLTPGLLLKIHFTNICLVILSLFFMSVVDTASLTWILVATAMIWIMLPGIGLFYSGMTKRKSALSLLWLSFMSLSVTSVQVC